MDNELSSSNYMNQLQATANLNKKKLAESKNSIIELNIRLNGLKNEIQNLQKQLFFQTASLTGCELIIKFSKKQITSFQDKKAILDNKIEETKRTLEVNEQTLKNNRDDLSSEVFKISKDIVEGKVSLRELKSDFESRIKSYSFELNQVEQDILKIKQNIQVIDKRNNLSKEELGKNAPDKLKDKKEGLIKQVQTLNIKLDKCLITKEQLNNAPLKDPEFLRLKLELQNKKNKVKRDASRVNPPLIGKGIQKPIKLGGKFSIGNRKLKQMFKQRRIDEFWSVTK